MITRTERFERDHELIGSIQTMEQAGWAVRQIAMGQSVCYIVFERES